MHVVVNFCALHSFKHSHSHKWLVLLGSTADKSAVELCIERAASNSNVELTQEIAIHVLGAHIARRMQKREFDCKITVVM